MWGRVVSFCTAEIVNRVGQSIKSGWDRMRRSSFSDFNKNNFLCYVTLYFVYFEGGFVLSLF